MAVVNFPSGYFPLPNQSGALALGQVYIGAPNTDPTVLGNRINVTLIQQNGTPVVIQPEEQPFVLNAGGLFVYNGSVVQLRVDVDYAMAIHSPNDSPLFYFPSVLAAGGGGGGGGGDNPLVLPVLPNHPAPVANAGIVYTLLQEGIAELFYMNQFGARVQLTKDGNFNIQLTQSVIEALELIAEEQVEGIQFRGDTIILEIDGDNNVDLDMSLGLNYSLTLTQNVNTFYFSNAPSIRVPNIVLEIINTGAYTIATFAPRQEGYGLWIPDTVDGLQPFPNATTSYGGALMPNQRIHIFPVLMKLYVP